MEEPESIETADADFRRYLELASMVVAAPAGATSMPAGSSPTPGRSGARSWCAGRTPLDVPAGRAATIFSLNLATWGDDRAVRAVAGPSETAELAARLDRRGAETDTGVIRWWMRQLVVRRPTGAGHDSDDAVLTTCT